MIQRLSKLDYVANDEYIISSSCEDSVCKRVSLDKTRSRVVTGQPLTPTFKVF